MGAIYTILHYLQITYNSLIELHIVYWLYLYVEILVHSITSFDKWFQICTLCLLKLPSLFAAWFIWTFHNKSHNMKALVILSHSWSPFLPLTCLNGKKNFCGSLCTHLEYFLKKTPPRSPFSFKMRKFYKIIQYYEIW